MLVALLISPINFTYGQQSSPGYPIEITNLQQQYVVGSDVEIKGTAIPPQTAKDQLTVTIIPPDGALRTIQTSPDSEGNFLIKLQRIAPAGRFKLSITGFGNAERKQIEFDVVEATGAIEKSKARLESLVRNSTEVITNVQRHLSSRPQDSDTVSVLRQLERLASEHSRVAARTTRAVSAIGHLQTALASEPRLRPAVIEGLSELSRWHDSAADIDENLKSLAARTRNMPTKCDSLDTAGEGLALLQTAMNIIAPPFSILPNLMLDKVNPAIMNLRTDANENARFAAAEAVKESEAALEGMTKLKTSVIGLSIDISQFVVGKLFANYCSVIEGPVESDFNVDHKKGNLSWWKYRIVLKGKFRLWAEKDQPVGADGVVYTGKLEGNTVKIEFFEDIFRVEQPPMGRIFLRKRITPVVLGNTANDPFGFGQVAHRITPGYFNIRYKGQLKDDKMALHQETILSDFTDLYMNRSIIVVIPEGGLLPVIKTFNFPIQKAAWMINRTTKGNFILPVTRVNDKMTLKQTFTRDETLSDGVSKVTFKVDYKLSN